MGVHAVLPFSSNSGAVRPQRARTIVGVPPLVGRSKGLLQDGGKRSIVESQELAVLDAAVHVLSSRRMEPRLHTLCPVLIGVGHHVAFQAVHPLRPRLLVSPVDLLMLLVAHAYVHYSMAKLVDKDVLAGVTRVAPHCAVLLPAGRGGDTDAAAQPSACLVEAAAICCLATFEVLMWRHVGRHLLAANDRNVRPGIPQPPEEFLGAVRQHAYQDVGCHLHRLVGHAVKGHDGDPLRLPALPVLAPLRMGVYHLHRDSRLDLCPLLAVSQSDLRRLPCVHCQHLSPRSPHDPRVCAERKLIMALPGRHCCVQVFVTVVVDPQALHVLLGTIENNMRDRVRHALLKRGGRDYRCLGPNAPCRWRRSRPRRSHVNYPSAQAHTQRQLSPGRYSITCP
mmetsp:Transcript_15719/g.43977  ORF Transcript_15719/g.43977 Transcript_15719/m.43977 type:complete len:394 (+) Transcript_15719:466-1647(+)